MADPDGVVSAEAPPTTGTREEARNEVFQTHAPSPWWMTIGTLAVVYMLHSGIENGVTPSVLTSIQSRYNATNVNVALAQRMSEISKTLATVAYGHFGARNRSLWIMLAGTIVAVGTVVISQAASLVLTGVGYFIFGAGYAGAIVLTPPLIDETIAGANIGRQKTPFYLGVVFTISALGVVGAYLISGIFSESWQTIYLSFGFVSMAFA